MLGLLACWSRRIILTIVDPRKDDAESSHRYRNVTAGGRRRASQTQARLSKDGARRRRERRDSFDALAANLARVLDRRLCWTLIDGFIDTEADRAERLRP